MSRWEDEFLRGVGVGALIGLVVLGVLILTGVW